MLTLNLSNNFKQCILSILICRNECKVEVEKFPKARYKKFETELEAKAFVSGFDHPGRANGSKMVTVMILSIRTDRSGVLGKQ